MIEHLQRLFSYDDWANREVLGALQALKVAEADLPGMAGFLAGTLQARSRRDAEALEDILAIAEGGWPDPFVKL